ncbi:putative glycerol kinase 3 [Hypsibius exemplaris]|uniref:Probable glycerol kinase n=1 Tax=Hypsibius exemplaris TaxID=2072580 RepID=A0A1W0WGB1_HYPEX|nr:putative glycerol kinase 3 [Hypsibius exemplaris]
MGRPDGESLIATLDAGTSSIRCMIFGSQRQVLAMHQLEIRRIYPEPSWVEQDPRDIMAKSIECINKAVDDLIFAGYGAENIKGLGITNQRETTVVWDKRTGEPLYNAILWLDNRTADLSATLIAGKGKGQADCLQAACGLPIHPYFSALKLRWMMDNVPAVKESINTQSCLFGTVDSWILWNLTGGVAHGVHKTDVTNASRSMLMNLKTLQWDDKLIDFFGIPKTVLPQICSSSEIYGDIRVSHLAGRPVAGILGDQMAALVGHGCMKPGTAKNTYGTGCFLLANIGEEIKISKHGLLTTVAYQLGPESQPVYALEGSVAIAGAVITWLQKNLQMIDQPDEVDRLAGSVSDSGGIYFVPAFSGLFAPHWDTEARGTICGLTEYVHKAHFARAALESVAFQVCEIVDAIKFDSGVELSRIQVDGGMSHSNLLMQFQADMSAIPVCVPKMAEITSLGAAIAAARAVGCTEFFRGDSGSSSCDSDDYFKQRFLPKITPEERSQKYSYWKEAVQRSMHWNKNSRRDPKPTSPDGPSRFGVVAVAAVGGALTSLAVAGLVFLTVQKFKR